LDAFINEILRGPIELQITQPSHKTFDQSEEKAYLLKPHGLNTASIEYFLIPEWHVTAEVNLHRKADV
jgi:hypothetical protein